MVRFGSSTTWHSQKKSGSTRNMSASTHADPPALPQMFSPARAVTSAGMASNSATRHGSTSNSSEVPDSAGSSCEEKRRR